MSRAEFYRMVSGVIRSLMDDPDITIGEIMAHKHMARALANAFAKHNTKFDAERFMRDAGVKV